MARWAGRQVRSAMTNASSRFPAARLRASGEATCGSPAHRPGRAPARPARPAWPPELNLGGASRRARRRSRSRAALLRMVCSQERTELRPSKPGRPRQARSSASCSGVFGVVHRAEHAVAVGLQLGPGRPDLRPRALSPSWGPFEQGPLRPALLPGLQVFPHPSPLRRALPVSLRGHQSVNVGSAPSSARARPFGSSQSSDLPNRSGRAARRPRRGTPFPGCQKMNR